MNIHIKTKLGVLLAAASAVLTAQNWPQASSMFNFSNLTHAYDGDPATCATTGLESWPWAVFPLPDSQVVSYVTFTGSFKGRLRIKIGNNEGADIGNVRENIEDASLCGVVATVIELEAPPITTSSVQCVWPLRGKYLVIEGEALDLKPSHLHVCEILFY